MKKTLTVVFLLLFGLAFHARAVSDNANQGNKNSQAVSQSQGNQKGNAVQAEEKNKVKNQREGDQIQTWDENAFKTQDKTKKDNKGQANAENHRSVVANFVQGLLEIADRESGIGEQVRVIAREQNAAKEQTSQEIEKIQARSKIRTFFFGSDYKNLGDLRSQMVQTRNQIAQLTRLAEQAESEESKAELQNQIQVLEQEQARISDFITQNENKFSLFGWAIRLFQ